MGKILASAVLLRDIRMLTGKKLFIIFIVFILTLYISSADTVTPQTPKALFTRSGFRLAGRF